MSDATTLTARTWPEGTHVTLMNVPWDEAYRDVVAWSSVAERDQWLDSQADVMLGSTVTFTYLWPNQPVSVPIPYSSCYRFNYCVVDNPAQPVDDDGPLRRYCYFVTGVEYLSPQASRLTLQLDVMTTYAGQIELGRAFVERGHIAMANGNARGIMTGKKLNDYLSLPEGLDVGSEYVSVHKEFVPLNSDAKGTWIVIISTADLLSNPGVVNSPNLHVATGSWADGLPSACEVYMFRATELEQVMQELQDKSWVAQCIISMYAFPANLFTSEPVVAGSLFGEGPKLYRVADTDSYETEGNLVASVTGVFDHLSPDDAPEKMLAYPYSVIELSAHNGNSVFLKPQLLTGDSVQLRAMGCALAPFARVALFTVGYAANYDPHMGNYDFSVFDMRGEATTRIVAKGDFLESALYLTDFPQFAIVNNNYLTYLASTVNTRDYQYQSAGWMLDRSNAQAGLSYDNALLQVGATMQNALTMQNATLENASRSRNQSAVESVVGGLSQVATGYGNPAQMGVGVASGLMGVAGALNSYQNAANMAGAQFSVSMVGADTTRDIAGNNYDLAQRVNLGDYQNKIASVNATVQDAALRPPSAIGQSGGNGFNFKNNLVGVTINFKTITGAARASVADYFRRYGYAVRRWLDTGTVRHMLCMEHFAYWKLLETYVIAAPANESERQTIRGVFEKGVTLWDAPESIGNTAATDNAPCAGYSY